VLSQGMAACLCVIKLTHSLALSHLIDYRLIESMLVIDALSLSLTREGRYELSCTAWHSPFFHANKYTAIYTRTHQYLISECQCENEKLLKPPRELKRERHTSRLPISALKLNLNSALSAHLNNCK
jgi:hypothetical protein